MTRPGYTKLDWISLGTCLPCASQSDSRAVRVDTKSMTTREWASPASQPKTQTSLGLGRLVIHKNPWPGMKTCRTCVVACTHTEKHGSKVTAVSRRIPDLPGPRPGHVFPGSLAALTSLRSRRTLRGGGMGPERKRTSLPKLHALQAASGVRAEELVLGWMLFARPSSDGRAAFFTGRCTHSRQPALSRAEEPRAGFGVSAEPEPDRSQSRSRSPHGTRRPPGHPEARAAGSLPERPKDSGWDQGEAPRGQEVPRTISKRNSWEGSVSTGSSTSRVLLARTLHRKRSRPHWPTTAPIPFEAESSGGFPGFQPLSDLAPSRGAIPGPARAAVGRAPAGAVAQLARRQLEGVGLAARGWDWGLGWAWGRRSAREPRNAPRREPTAARRSLAPRATHRTPRLAGSRQARPFARSPFARTASPTPEIPCLPFRVLLASVLLAAAAGDRGNRRVPSPDASSPGRGLRSTDGEHDDRSAPVGDAVVAGAPGNATDPGITELVG